MRPRVSLSYLLILSLTALLLGAGWQAPRVGSVQPPAVCWSTAEAHSGFVALCASEQAASDAREVYAPLLSTVAEPWRVSDAPLTGVLRHSQHAQHAVPSAPTKLQRARAPPSA